MKKLWILLVVLAVFGAAPLFADVTFSGEFMGFASTDFDTISGAFPKVELNGVAEIDDFNTLKLELDVEGTDWSGYTDPDGNFTFTDDGDEYAIAKRNVALDDIRLITDWGKALGLEGVGIKTTIGYFDTYFTGWFYYDASGWTWYYDWPDGVIEQGPDANGAMEIDITAGPVMFRWYNDMAGEDILASAEVTAAGLDVWLGYAATFGGFGDGVLALEAGYKLMDMLNIGAFFRYSLADNTAKYALGENDFSTGLNLGADFGMLHAAVGFEGDSVTDGFLDNGVIELAVSPVEAAKIAVVAFLDLGGEAFNSLDISASYMVGAAKFILGYQYVVDGGIVTPAFASADNYYPDGFYLGVDVDY
jgi:hypothetical protein